MLMANEVPEELVPEILLCLPVVSLLRFNCVCKSWYALITHQNFIRKRLLHNKNNNTLLLLWRDKTTEDKVVSTISYETLPATLTQPRPLPFTKVTSFVGSCDGLVCLCDYDALNVVIWNPATKETKVVPNSRLSRFSYKYRIKSGIGFGFDAKTSDYKIIKFFSLFDSYESDADGHVPCYRFSEVYSLRANSWRKVDSRPGLIYVTPIDTYINGMASWEAFDFDDHWEGVLSFDMSSEVFLKTPLPVDVDDVLNSPGWKNFFVLNESIAMAFWSGDKEWLEICCDIWLLLEVGVKDSWTRLFTFGPITNFMQPQPSGFWTSDAVLFTNYNGQVVLYDPSTKEMTNLQIPGEKVLSQLVTYKETLVSVNGRK